MKILYGSKLPLPSQIKLDFIHIYLQKQIIMLNKIENMLNRNMRTNIMESSNHPSMRIEYINNIRVDFAMSKT